MEKVFVTDDYSAVGIAGTAGWRIELRAAVHGRAVALREDRGRFAVPRTVRRNKLAPRLVRDNLDMAMGRPRRAVPLFVGYESTPTTRSRIVSYDVVGGRYEERRYHRWDGLGVRQVALKKLYDPAGDRDAAVRAAVEALYDAADHERRHRGPGRQQADLPDRHHHQGADGAVHLPESETGAVAEA